MNRSMTKLFVTFMIVTFSFNSALLPAARAVLIETPAFLESEREPARAGLHEVLARKDVREQLIALGVDPRQADIRVASLSDSELELLQERMAQLPAGANALAIIGAVFLVLIILEIVGVTNVFSKL